MNANLKLLKKKRIAHIGSKLPDGNCEESRLQPDDVVYNIIKDMDSNKNVYQQLQESKSQKRLDKSINEEELNYLQNKKAKKVLPKKTFPLMKKCQTSLQHLKKNMCIPKPRAHVGVVTKPEHRPILNVQQSVSRVGYSNNVNKIATKNANSKKPAKPIHTDSPSATTTAKDSKIKGQRSPKTVKPAAQTSQVVDYSSSDDDNAFEKFVQRNRCDSSDSDSRIVIHRKKKTKSKRKKTREHSPAHKKCKKNLPKVTSMPLMDSSDSESQGTLGVERDNNYSNPENTTDIIKTISPDNLGRSVESDDSLMDTCNFNYDSSGSEFNLTATSNLVADDQMSRVPTKCVPCFVRLKRDPDLDRKAALLSSPYVIYSSKTADTYGNDNDCIIISEDSDNDMPEIPKLNSSSLIRSDGAELEDCVIMCEIPKIDIPNHSKLSNNNAENKEERVNVTMTSNLKQFDEPLALTSKDIYNLQDDTHNEAKTDGCALLYEENSDAIGSVSKSTNELSNLEVAHTSELHSESGTAQVESSEFNVQIVSVHSLVETHQPLTEPHVPETNNVEFIDISDDELPMPNTEVEKSIINNEENCNLPPINLNESIVNEPHSNLSSLFEPDPKILEMLKKIDFDCIKEVLYKTDLDNSVTGRNSSSCSNKILPEYESSSTIVSEVNSNRKNNDSATQNAKLKNDKITQNENTSEQNYAQIKGGCKSLASHLNESQESSHLLVECEKSGKIYRNLEIEIPCENAVTCTNSNRIELQIKTVPMDSNTALKTMPQILKDNKGNFPMVAEMERVATCNVGKELDNKNLVITKPFKNEVIESPADELDVIAATYITDLNPTDKKAQTLFNMYQTELEKYKQIRNTEMNIINVSAGLQLLEERQMKKIVNLQTAIKNLAKHDACFYKANEAYDTSTEFTIKKVNQVPKSVNIKELKQEDLGKRPTIAVNSNVAGPSEEKMLKLLKECRCAQCGKPATARCQGCAAVYYCSPLCGMQSWKDGHFALCKRMKI